MYVTTTVADAHADPEREARSVCSGSRRRGLNAPEKVPVHIGRHQHLPAETALPWHLAGERLRDASCPDAYYIRLSYAPHEKQVLIKRG